MGTVGGRQCSHTQHASYNTRMAASSVICFKNGYSFLSVPVSLGGDNGEGQVEESTLGSCA